MFVCNLEELEKYFGRATKDLTEKNHFWLFYPQTSSKIKSNLNRDIIIKFVKKFNFKISKLVSFDQDWSAFLIKKLIQKK